MKAFVSIYLLSSEIVVEKDKETKVSECSNNIK